MIVNLIKNTQMFSVTLPKKINGQYWLCDTNENGQTVNLVSIEERDNRWTLLGNKNITIKGTDGQSFQEIELVPDTFLFVNIRETGEQAIIYTESLDETHQKLSKILAKEAGVFQIGRNDNNNISFENKFVSSRHSQLSYDGDHWSVKDLNSRNGTYVNGIRVNSKKLLPGDCIYIMGLRIIIGKDFFAMNNPYGQVHIKSDVLERYEIQRKNVSESKNEKQEKKFFSKSPRFYREIVEKEIKIDPPPTPEKMDSVPMALMLGPSMTMGFTSLCTGIISVMNVMSSNGSLSSALPSLLMSVGMLCGTVLWPIMTKKYEKKQKIKNERKRHRKYLLYLNEIGDDLKKISEEQSEILNNNIVSTEECADRILREKTNLWEREISHEDFLKVRIGVGNAPVNASIKYQEKGFTMDDDTLQNAMLSLAEGPKMLSDVPIGFSITENTAIGIYGQKEMTDSFVKSIILQMIALHSYDELKLILIVDEDEEENWKFVKCIPHFWSDDKSIRLFAACEDEVKFISNYIEKNVANRVDADAKAEIYTPYYVCLFVGKNNTDKMESAFKIIKNKTNIGFTGVFLGRNFSDFPKETKSIIHVNTDRSRLFDKENTTGSATIFKTELGGKIQLSRISQSIANIQLELKENSFALPSMVTFLEMFNVGKVEHLNSLVRWKDNNPSKSLQVPVGINEEGKLFGLDLHENYHGPHGLVAGMTGSGKSEFIITYILSLCVNFHPNEVSFILIDYKGGGLTGAFENEEKGIRLPHLSGTITNLDGSAIKRSLISIQSELRRRQSIFNDALKHSNEGTMDIYKYQQLFRERVVSEPLPHLFIISDEFAELKKQQPEFMDQLISAARIGRSLGVHLILATQKPNGVVDDENWGNSKFRVCLKVQEKADSQDMIKCPDAAELTQTGRFYLQVGYNEFFAVGQSAWCGADYEPSDIIEKSVDKSIKIIDNVGRSVLNVSEDKKVKAKTKRAKQVVEVVKYLTDLAKSEGVTTKKLWLDPIPETIYFDDLVKKYGVTSKGTFINPIIGEFDDPANQKQSVLTLPISKDGNCIVYGSSGSGKTTFLTTLCYSLIRSHSPSQLNLYIADFGAETLKMFEKSPQVGGFISSSDEERITNLFKMLYSEIDRRKAMFSDFGGDYQSYCKFGQESIPNIVVVINNYSGFSEQYENLNDSLLQLSRDGIRYGIYFVISAESANAVRYKIQQNFKTLITLQLNDSMDYSSIVGRTEGLVPSPYKGRGLVLLDHVYEFQTAYCCNRDDIQMHVREVCMNMAKNSDSFAKTIPILPKIVDYTFVEPYINDISNVPVGVEKNSLNISTINLKNRVAFPIYGIEMDNLVRLTKGLNNVLQKTVETVVIDADNIFGEEYTISGRDAINETVETIFGEMVERHNAYVDSKSDRRSLESFDENVFLIVGFKSFYELLSEDCRDKMNVLLDKAQSIFKIHFIVVDTSNNVSSYSSNGWYRKQISGSEGMWIGDGFADQYYIKTGTLSGRMYEDIGDEYGYVVEKTHPILIKLLTEEEE